jgi:hypothetical protein
MNRGAIRGSRMTGPSAGSVEVDRGGRADRAQVEFWCAHDHCSTVVFSADAELPEAWTCQACGETAARDRGTAAHPTHRSGAPHKTPYEFMMMRRTPADGERLLAEALRKLRAERTV